jgi:hypothetical protein
MSSALKTVQQVVAGLLAAGLLAYGAAKGYAWWRVKENLDSLARSVRPFVELRYDGIGTELSGAVEVSGVLLTPAGFTEPVRVAAVRLETGDPLFLFRGFADVQREPPERVAARLRGVRVPLQGEYAELSAAASQGEDVCAIGGLPRPELLAALGMEVLELDVGVEYTLRQADGRVVVGITYATAGVDSTVASIELAGVGRGSNPTLRRGDVTYTPDPELTPRLVDYCAKRRGMDRETFIDASVDAADRQLYGTHGVVLGPGLREALQRYLRKPAEVRVALRPGVEVGLQSYMGLSPDQVLDTVGAELYVGGERVVDLSLRREAPAGSADATGRAVAGDAAATPAPVVEKPRFQQRPVAELGQYLNHTVRVHERGGLPPREGRLASISEGRADIDQRMLGGHMTAHVRVEDIAQLEVLLPVK